MKSLSKKIRFSISLFTFLLSLSAFSQTPCNCDQATYQLVQVMNVVVQNTDPKEAPELESLYTRVHTYYLSIVEKALKANNISYEILTSSNENSKRYGREWKYFNIIPKDSSPLNILAKKLSSLYITTAFDPVFLMLNNGRGAYSSKLNTLFLPEVSLASGGKDLTTEHELLHGLLDAGRKGYAKFNSKLPVNIEFKSSSPAVPNPSGAAAAYSQYMSFEEMLTHAINISYLTDDVLEGSSDSLPLRKSITTLTEISQYARISASFGIQLLSDQKNVSIEKDSENGLKYVKISRDDNFSIKIFLPAIESQKAGFNVANFAKIELQKAIQLAEFNINYFADVNLNTNLSETDLKLASAFREAQESTLR